MIIRRTADAVGPGPRRRQQERRPERIIRIHVPVRNDRAVRGLVEITTDDVVGCSLNAVGAGVDHPPYAIGDVPGIMSRSGRAVAVVRRAGDAVRARVQGIIDGAVNAVVTRVRYVKRLELQRAPNDEI